MNATKPTSLMVRVKYSSSVAGYTACTMVAGAGRQSASSTSSAHQAATRAAAKGLGVTDSDVLLFESNTDKPVPWDSHVGNAWVAFDARVKGSTSQLSLLPGGAS
ncbi:hypothetical protein [Prosthecobacter sp.]|uniref:hypothetical protein n=1 Tax=Prosthecobacter sp. TaxID=1965333 RepID=UPI00378477C8